MQDFEKLIRHIFGIRSQWLLYMFRKQLSRLHTSEKLDHGKSMAGSTILIKAKIGITGCKSFLHDIDCKTDVVFFICPFTPESCGYNTFFIKIWPVLLLKHLNYNCLLVDLIYCSPYFLQYIHILIRLKLHSFKRRPISMYSSEL